jgi:hypothetical protein
VENQGRINYGSLINDFKVSLLLQLQDPSWEANSHSALHNIPFYRTKGLIAMFPETYHNLVLNFLRTDSTQWKASQQCNKPTVPPHFPLLWLLCFIHFLPITTLASAWILQFCFVLAFPLLVIFFCFCFSFYFSFCFFTFFAVCNAPIGFLCLILFALVASPFLFPFPTFQSGPFKSRLIPFGYNAPTGLFWTYPVMFFKSHIPISYDAPTDSS